MYQLLYYRMICGLDMFLQGLLICSFIPVHLATVAVSKTPVSAPHFVHPVTLIALPICSANATEKVYKTSVGTFDLLPTLHFKVGIIILVGNFQRVHFSWFLQKIDLRRKLNLRNKHSIIVQCTVDIIDVSVKIKPYRQN